MKNTIKYFLQRILGYERYLFVFAKYKIKNLRNDKKEGDFFAFLAAIEKEGDILDIGANIGIMTVHLAQRFSQKKIHCIEPEPTNLSILKRVIQFYKLENTAIHQTAVGNEETDLEMVLPVQNNVKMQGLTHVVHDSINEWNEGEKFTVNSTQLDTLFPNVKIAAIKMDIENFEFFALEGAQNLLRRDRPVIYLELWENENREKCFTFLRDLGYIAYIAFGESLKPYQGEQTKQNFIFK